MYDPALSFWSINSTGLLHPSCRPLWPPRISSAALAERLLWLGVEVRGWWDLLLMLWCVVNTFNYCCHCSWWLNGLPMGVPLGFMISETNGGPFEVIGIYIYIHVWFYTVCILGIMVFDIQQYTIYKHRNDMTIYSTHTHIYIYVISTGMIQNKFGNM